MTLKIFRPGRTSAVTVALLATTVAAGLTQTAALAEDSSTGGSSGERIAVATTGSLGTLGDRVVALGDIDARGSAVPTLTQLRAVADLGVVDVRWNELGTPASLLPRDGILARATSDDPGIAARNWLRDNASVFGLTQDQVAAMTLVNEQEFAYSPARAVLFRQDLAGLVPALGGLVTVGVANGEIAYASSSITRSTGTAPEARLTPLEGWVRAAENVGLDLGLAEIAQITSKVAGGWTRLVVPGIAQQQQVRLRGLGLADGAIRPVLEANVVNVAGGASMAYTVLVDAVSGEVLFRHNLVDQDSSITPYSGSVTTGSCGPKHRFTLQNSRTRSIAIVANAVNPANDIVINLYDPAGAILASGDLLTSPETLTYSAASIPAGTYSAEVCPFENTAQLPPTQYGLVVSTSESSTPGPGAIADALTGDPRWRYFPGNPALDFRPNTTPRNSVIGCWFKGPGCTSPTGSFKNVAAPGPWDIVVNTGLSTFTTTGNNAATREAWASPLTPGGLLQAPISPTRKYDAAFTDAWNNSKCNPSELVPGGNDIEFATGNLFVAHNRMHDFSYYLGFTEDNYNLQLDNIGRGGIEGDPEIGNVQAGALTGGSPVYLGRDNANQITLQDGIPGITNQYLFQPIAGSFYAPCADGSLDMGIVAHEYTHAVSNRMVGGPDEGLSSEQGGAMGESWSDLAAGEYMFAHNYSNGGNVWAVGAYATGNGKVAIRDYAINKSPLNYSNYGFDSTGPEVHADGEIWNGTMWEVRQALVEKYNKRFPASNKSLQLRCAQGNDTTGVTPPSQCPGNRRWMQLVFDSFLLQQGATSMLDARDAMIAADRMRFKGVNNDLMWDAFSRRGMGIGAFTSDGNDVSVKGSFRSPTSRNTKVQFKAPSGGRIFVGDYEARVTPVADTMRKTKLKSSTSFTPGTYDLLFVAPGRGFHRFSITVDGKARSTVKIAAPKNLAARAAGAKLIGATKGSRNPAFLIDGTEGTNWAGVTAANVDASKPFVAVDLAGGKHTVRRVNVSAYLVPAPPDPNEIPLLRNADPDPDSGSRFTALRKFAVEACVTACASKNAKWKRIFTSAANAFPGARPRPVAPNLTLRSFKVKPTRAAALRLVVLENQCTGFAGYAGEQDNDPLNDTDCKTASDRGTIVHAAEFQAFS